MVQQNKSSQNFTPLKSSLNPNYTFVRYLMISLAVHIFIAVIFYVVVMLGALTVLGSTSPNFVIIMNFIITFTIGAVMLFEVFLLRKKLFSITRRLMVAFVPLALAIAVFVSINPAGQVMVKNMEARAFNDIRAAVHFGETFSVEESENAIHSHHSIIVPFRSDREFGLNKFIFAYYVEIEGQPIDSNGQDLSQCPTDNNIFTKIVDQNGKNYEVDSYNGDGIKLPPGQYYAHKELAVNAGETMEQECYAKVLNLLKTNRKLNIYSVNISLDQKNSKDKLIKEVLLNNSSEIIIPTQSASLSQGTIPSPKPGFKQYTDEKLKYGYSYHESQTVDVCASDFPCSSIKEISLNVTPLDSVDLMASDPKSSLLASDLYCSAGGVSGSKECKNINVDDYTNLIGVRGYKIYRTITRSGDNPGTYTDVAYVFPIPVVVKGDGLINYSGVLFSVDTVTNANTLSMEEIVNSYFTL